MTARVGQAAETAGQNGAAPVDSQPDVCIPVEEYAALPREAVVPYVATTDGRSVILSRNTLLLVAGPAGVGKSIAGAWDLGGKLADDTPSTWLGLSVTGGMRVLLLSFEGSDEDTADRVKIVPESAQQGRFLIWDRWARGSRRAVPPPRADEAGIGLLVKRLREHQSDVLVIDTGAKFFSPMCDASMGIPEEAGEVIDRIRDAIERPLAVIVIAHTRKLDAKKAADELEEIAGRFGVHADSAIVIRRDKGDRGPRRKVAFAKCRRGPDLPDVIATFPTDESEPPRLTIVTDLGGAEIKSGTEAETMAAWIREQDHPVTAAMLRSTFDISDSTLNRRKLALEAFGIRCAKPPTGFGNARSYGTEDQWMRLLGARLTGEEAS